MRRAKRNVFPAGKTRIRMEAYLAEYGAK